MFLRSDKPSSLLSTILLAGGLAVAAGAEAAEKVSWVGLDWNYETFDNGQGLAGYTLTNESIGSPEPGCSSAAKDLFSRLDGVDGALRQGNPLVLRTNQSLDYRLKYGVDMEASVYESGSGCGARITVLNPLEWPR